jgi:hypothetical protein
MARKMYSLLVFTLTLTLGISTYMIAEKIFHTVVGWRLAQIVTKPSTNLVEPIVNETVVTKWMKSDERLRSEVYEAVLDSDGYDVDEIVVLDTTSDGWSFEDNSLTLPSALRADASTMESFLVNQLRPLSLRQSFEHRPDVHLVSEKQVDDITDSPDSSIARELRKIAPGVDRIVTLSNVGFNTDRTQALVYVTYYSSSLSSAGSFIVLDLVGDRWVVSNEAIMWVS